MEKLKVTLHPQTAHKAKIQPFANETRTIEVDKSKPFIPKIIQELKAKGVNSNGNISNIADDIKQIKGVNDIDPGEFFKVEEREKTLTFELTRDIYTGASGKDIPYNGWSITNYIDIDGFDYINMLNGSVPYSCYYDKDKEPLGVMTSPKYDKVPAGAKFLRISNATAAIANLNVKGGNFIIVRK